MAISERLIYNYQFMEMNEKVVLCWQRLAVLRTHLQQMTRLRPGSSITSQDNGCDKGRRALSCCTSGHQTVYQPVL